MRTNKLLSPYHKLKLIQRRFDLYNFEGTTLKEAIPKIPKNAFLRIKKNAIEDALNKSADLNLLELLIVRLKESLLFILDEKSKNFIKTNVAIGMSPDYSINAKCIKLSNPYFGFIILLDYGIMHLSYELLKLGLSLFFKRMNINLFQKNVIKLLDNFVKKKFFTYTGFRLKSNDEIELLSHLIEGVEFIILCHEFSHFNKNHFNQAIEKEEYLFGERFTTLNYNQKLEKEADIGAMELIFKTNFIPKQFKDEFIPLFASSSIILYLILDLLEKFLKIKSNSHPPAKVRKEYIMEFLLNSCNIPLEHFVIANHFEKCFKEIWL